MDCQTGCQTPPTNASESADGLQQAFPKNANVDVYFDATGFDNADISAMKAAFQAWQSSDTSSGVTYNFIVVSGPPVATRNFIVVSRDNSLNPSFAMQTDTQITNAGSYDIIDNATIAVNPALINDPSMEQKMAHEIGHLLGLGDCDSCPLGTSVMAFGDTMNGANGVNGPTTCDLGEEESTFPPYNPPPPPPPDDCNVYGCTCGGTCEKDGHCTYTFECSPILIAIGQSAEIELTSAQDGVWFDLEVRGARQWVAWTQKGEAVAFLVHDVNHNGRIDDGSELFGNHTVLPNGAVAPNGFYALGAYDLPEHGGNGDGVIDSKDAIWNELKLWIDWNHNGLSEPNELYGLGDFGLTQISLDYQSTTAATNSGIYSG